MTDEVVATEHIAVETVDQAPAGKGPGELIRTAVLVISLLLNVFQSFLGHQAQLRAEERATVAAKQARQSLEDARKDAEARRINERQEAAEKIVQSLWSALSKGSGQEYRLAIAAVTAVWPELADKLEAAGRAQTAVHPESTGAERRVPRSPGHSAPARSGTLLEQARTLEHFRLYAQADRAYIDAVEAVRFESQDDRQLLMKATNDYNAGRFSEAATEFHHLFDEVEKQQ